MMNPGLCGLLLGLALAGAGVRADAQVAGAPAVPIPLEVTAEMRGGRVECRPTVARLPAGQVFDLSVVNRTDRSIRFESNVLVSAHPPAGRASTGVPASRVVTAAPRGTARLSFRSPDAGEYPFRCAEDGGGDRDDAPDGRFVVIAIDPRR